MPANMKQNIRTKFTVLLLCFISFHGYSYSQHAPESKLGWQLGVQTWSFNKFTLAEALDKADSVGVTYIQAYPGQPIGGGIEATLDFTTIDRATEEKVLQLLKQKGITMVSYGVAGPKDEKEWQQLSSFAKKDTIDLTNTPPVAKADLLKRLQSLLSRQIWRAEGYYEISNETDPMIKKALEVLR